MKIIINKSDYLNKRIDLLIPLINSSFSRSQVQKLIKDGLVKVNDKNVKANYLVKLKDTITIDTKKEKAGYCFIANIMGNGKSGVFNEGTISYPTSDAIITDLTNAELVWESKQGLISNIQLQHGYIRFIVNSTTEGNAVIAVTDNSGKYLWSWHIWITDKPQDIDVEITSGRTVTFMDRNLGAVEYAEGSDVLKTFGIAHPVRVPAVVLH